MSLRETLNRNPAITTGATLLIIVIAVGFIIYSQLPSSGPTIPTSSFYTSDDGATWFKEDAKAIPPITVDGKEAYRAYVYQCGSDEPFVAYMERYTPQARKAMEAMQADPEGNDPNLMMQYQNVMQMGVQYKRPGQKDWLTMMDPRYGQVMNVTCPDGQTIPEPVRP